MTTQSIVLVFALKAGLCVLFISVLLMGSTTLPATAQSAQSPNVLVADAATVHELVQKLTSPIKEERKQALRQITDLARYAPEVDFTSAVTALVEIYSNDPDDAYRQGAVIALHAIGNEAGMQGVRQHVLQEPSLHVQYVSVWALIDLYGPKAFGRNRAAVALARNVIARKHEAQRLAARRALRVWPRVLVGPLEVVEPDSLQ